MNVHIVQAYIYLGNINAYIPVVLQDCSEKNHKHNGPDRLTDDDE